MTASHIVVLFGTTDPLSKGKLWIHKGHTEEGGLLIRGFVVSLLFVSLISALLLISRCSPGAQPLPECLPLTGAAEDHVLHV